MNLSSMFQSRDLEVTMRWGYAIVKQVGRPGVNIMRPEVQPDRIVLHLISQHANREEAIGILMDIVADEEANAPDPEPIDPEPRRLIALPWIHRPRRERVT